ncbi:hypothetical protein [Actinoplanes sp. M2I2]|uniref:hypothetical protein n=1 Tax=Actinoplanes sp. M2I2 TaxID=1734444 RepID=UPI00201FC9D1|nr:hypothetical protein [Actinoplanes sp. M2I2]
MTISFGIHGNSQLAVAASQGGKVLHAARPDSHMTLHDGAGRRFGGGGVLDVGGGPGDRKRVDHNACPAQPRARLNRVPGSTACPAQPRARLNRVPGSTACPAQPRARLELS